MSIEPELGQKAGLATPAAPEKNRLREQLLPISGRARLLIGHLPVDVLRFAEALAAIAELVESGRGGAVFTPNVDHVVMAEADLAFRKAYQAAELCVVDGMPLVWASRLLRHPLPEKISGSDLLDPLMSMAGRQGWRVFLLGGAPGVAEAAARRFVELYRVKVVGTAAPRLPPGCEGPAVKEIIDRLRAARPELVLVAFGAPKQELLIDRVKKGVKPAVLVGVGAGLDFAAGRLSRAPRWLSEAGFEWLYRLLCEPRRLWRRYLVRDPRFALVLFRMLNAPPPTSF
jgi:N-acetylglucosaminyldiphosphoundecaprenol N-acetyl-beta-D-mannosaminyltransferase